MKAITRSVLIGISILAMTQTSAIAQSATVGSGATPTVGGGSVIEFDDVAINDSAQTSEMSGSITVIDIDSDAIVGTIELGSLSFSLGRRTLSTSEGDVEITEDMASFDEAQITLVSPTGERYLVSRAITQVEQSGNLLPSSSVSILEKKAYRMPSKNEQILLADTLGDGADMPCQKVKWRHDPATGQAHARCSAADRDAFKAETQNAIPYTTEYMSIDPGGIIGIDPGGIIGIDPGGIIGIDPGGIIGIDPGGILGIDPNGSGWSLEITDTNPLVENATASEVDADGEGPGDSIQTFFNRFEILDWNMELNP